MRRTIVLALTGTVVVTAALVQTGALAAPRREATLTAVRSTPVTIRIEGVKKTLLLPTGVDRTGSGSITKFGAPKGKCPRRSVQGVLDRVTHGHWKGTWYSQYNEYLVTSVMGEKPSSQSHRFWELFVDDKAAAKGACDVRLKPGERILFADTDGKHYPAELRVPRSARSGASFTVKLLGSSGSGKSKALAGVTVSGDGVKSGRTNTQGVAKVTANHSGRLILRASPGGYIRTEAVVHVSQ
jgi:hypothetical protein